MCAKRYLHARFDRLDRANLIETATWCLRRQSLTTCSLFKEKDDVLVVSRVFQAFQPFVRYPWPSIYVIDDRKFRRYVDECEKAKERSRRWSRRNLKTKQKKIYRNVFAFMHRCKDCKFEIFDLNKRALQAIEESDRLIWQNSRYLQHLLLLLLLIESLFHQFTI